MRRRALAFGLAAVVLAAAGCTGTSEPPAEEPEGPVSLVMWSTGDDDTTAAIQAAADVYKTKNPNVTVKVQTITWQDGKSKILSAANSKTGADIITGGLSWGIEFGAQGGMIDLRQQAGVIDKVKQNSIPSIWPSIVSQDGSTFGLPLDMSAYVLIGNPDVLARGGVTAPPKTWEELTAAIDKMKAAGVKYPFVIEWGSGGWLPYFNYLRQAGGNFYSKDCAQVTINSPEAVTAMQFYVDLYKKYGAPKETPDLANGLGKGEIGLVAAGNWNVTSIPVSVPALKDKMIVAPLPAGSANGATFLGGRIIGVTSYTKAPKAASEFSAWLASDPEAIKLVADYLQKKNGSLYLSNRGDQLANLTAKPETISTLQSIYATAEGPPNCPGWETGSAEVDKALQKALFDTATPKAALDEAAQIMQTNLKQ